jgi:hypothetical protein
MNPEEQRTRFKLNLKTGATLEQAPTRTHTPHKWNGGKPGAGDGT